MPDGKTYYAWPWERDGEFGNQSPPAGKDEADPFPTLSRIQSRLQAGANTTLVVVATSATMTNAEAKRIAMMAHDGIARAVRPAHTPFDGDVVYALSTAQDKLPEASLSSRPTALSNIGSAAADCIARAIARAVYKAAG
jgi:L-aminopeptidase/D-esterase-like protein